MKENSVQLPDGRRLSYAEYGHSGEAAVFAMHGTPGARIAPVYTLMEQIMQAPAAPAFRLIAAERPGYGNSDTKPDRTLEDVVVDIAYLANGLEIGKFHLFAVSGGAPFALACSQKFPDRVLSTAICAGLGPIYLPQFQQSLSAKEKMFLNSAEASISFARQAQASPAAFVQYVLSGMPEQERNQIPESMIEEYTRFLSESTRTPDGMVSDYRCFGQPWNVNFQNIHVPVRLWHSDTDQEVPLAHSQYVADTIPNASLKVVHGLSHLATSLTVVPEVLAFWTDPHQS